MDLLSRADAMEMEEPRFFTGVRCGRNHLSERYTSNGACIACVRGHAIERPRTHLLAVNVRRSRELCPADVTALIEAIKTFVDDWHRRSGFDAPGDENV